MGAGNDAGDYCAGGVLLVTTFAAVDMDGGVWWEAESYTDLVKTAVDRYRLNRFDVMPLIESIHRFDDTGEFVDDNQALARAFMLDCMAQIEFID